MLDYFGFVKTNATLIYLAQELVQEEIDVLCDTSLNYEDFASLFGLWF